jgi:hypothetical protein
MCSAIVDERRSGILRRDMSVVEWNFAVTFCECLGRKPRAKKLAELQLINKKLRT